MRSIAWHSSSAQLPAVHSTLPNRSEVMVLSGCMGDAPPTTGHLRLLCQLELLACVFELRQAELMGTCL